jgi:superfamily II DNA or RNA helicase
MGCSFDGKLRETQRIVQKEAIQKLNAHGCVLLALHVGFGKSILAIHLACKIGLRTLILVHRVLLIDQWVSSIRANCSSTVKICTYADYDPTSDVVVMNVVNVAKLHETERASFGLVIVDECHLISTEHFSRSLQYLTPRYLIGLSATPYRKDGMDKIMDLYFGKERIHRRLQIAHTVYKIQTSFVPPTVLMRNGQLDWNRVMDAQSNHVERNDMIARLVEMFPTRRILILCKRKQQGTTLIRLLEERGQHVTRLMGNDKKFDVDARVMIATINKAGVGFSHDVLDTLILAADVEEYYIQYLGRITRRPDVQPIIVDIVDNHPILQRHFRTRRRVYNDIGGTIHEFKKSFPDFSIV